MKVVAERHRKIFCVETIDIHNGYEYIPMHNKIRFSLCNKNTIWRKFFYLIGWKNIKSVDTTKYSFNQNNHHFKNLWIHTFFSSESAKQTKITFTSNKCLILYKNSNNDYCILAMIIRKFSWAENYS